MSASVEQILSNVGAKLKTQTEEWKTHVDRCGPLLDPKSVTLIKTS